MGSVLYKNCPESFSKTQRKTPVLESLFIDLQAVGLQLPGKRDSVAYILIFKRYYCLMRVAF